MEGMYPLGFRRLEAMFASHPGVLACATRDGIDVPSRGSRGIRDGHHTLYADVPVLQAERTRTLRHVSLLAGVGNGAEHVEAPDFLLSALVVKRGVDNAYIAVGGSLGSQLYGFDLAILGQDG